MSRFSSDDWEEFWKLAEAPHPLSQCDLYCLAKSWTKLPQWYGQLMAGVWPIGLPDPEPLDRKPSRRVRRILQLIRCNVGVEAIVQVGVVA